MSENNTNHGADSAEHQPTMAEVMTMMERNRYQAEQNQIRMMEQHTRLLEQLVTRSPVSSGPYSGTSNGGITARSRWTDFHKTRPPTFTVALETLEADDWIRDMERKLDTIQCTDQEKTLFASHQLQGQAAAWWMNHQALHPGRDIPWQEFKDAFHQAHVPTGVLASKHREFLALRQRGLTVTEYLHQFNYLARYAPNDVDTEEKKMEKFSEGLRKTLKFHISALDFKDMSAMVNKLIISEEARTELQELRKRKAMRMAPQPSAPRKRMMSAPPVQYQQQPTTNLNSRPEYNTNQSASIQCYTCGGNHHQRDCPQKSNNCYHCGQPGHFKSQCPIKHMSAEVAKAQVKSQSQINKKSPTMQVNKGGLLRSKERLRRPEQISGEGRPTTGPNQGKINYVTINEAAEATDNTTGHDFNDQAPEDAGQDQYLQDVVQEALTMVRKNRTGPPSAGESSGTQEATGALGRGPPQRAERAQQGGRGGGEHQGHGGCYQGGGGPASHQPGGSPVQYQAQEYYGHGGPRQRGMPQPYYGGHRSGSGGRGVPASPSRTVPELHQAPQVQYQAPVVTPSPSGTGSSLMLVEASTGQVQQQFQQLAIQGQSSTSQAIQPAPPSSKSVRFPMRPGKGTFGDRCIVKANHFFAELPDKDLHQYDVSITPEVTSRGVNRAVMRELVTLYRQSHLGGRLPAYDGRKSLYTAGPLPFTSRNFEIILRDEEDSLDGGQGAQRRERLFKLVIKFAARADLHHLAMFLAGRQADAPQEALQVLDIVLRELPSAKYSPVARSFYSPNLGRCQQLGEGLESWRGFYQSIRPTQMGLSLNIDMSSTAFFEPLPVIDFVAQLLNRDISIRPLSDADRVKIKKALRGVKVEVTHRGNMRRKYRISGLTAHATRELSFPIDDHGTVKTVVQYFQETYGFNIQHTTLPCLQVGNQQRPNYLPMEVCKIAEGQRYSKRLNEKQIAALLKVTCQRPQERELDILQTVHHNAYHEDPYAQEFGIRIDERLASVEARVLPPPWLKYHDSGREKDVLPRIGEWNMRNKKMVNGGRVNYWACINFSRHVQDNDARSFCRELAVMCQISGMDFSTDPLLPPLTARPEHVERALKERYQDAMNILKPQGRELDLLIVILPENNGPLYGDLKRICETDLGLVSQCCLKKHVFKISKQYLANVALKINVKVGGRNTVLVDALTGRIPFVSDRPTIIFGADVTHPHPGEDSSPSIAAVVASQDWPEVTKYAGLVSAQAHRQELIQDLFKVWQDPQRGTVTGGMIRELLISFKRSTGQKPQRIIFYRDGVSEGQFYQVLLYELDAIRKACASLEANYQPPVTFVVVQKRHHTRLFANNHKDQRTVDRSGNILPGTVVDSKICHPTEFDFYLCSHAGIQGTSRPAHYHVLWDENKFTADTLQTLTNNLCYTYARCTRSVSIVPPAHYAHLAAFRARFYMEPDTSDSGSMVSGATTSCGPPPGARSTRAAGNVAVRPLPDLKENVKRVMFYC